MVAEFTYCYIALQALRAYRVDLRKRPACGSWWRYLQLSCEAANQEAQCKCKTETPRHWYVLHFSVLFCTLVCSVNKWSRLHIASSLDRQFEEPDWKERPGCSLAISLIASARLREARRSANFPAALVCASRQNPKGAFRPE
ncbi:hypothetical protein N656DRAFT_267638 [Canariomyces notabilis]|uniref:Uncharacterized protein n=1 Tax=Canariomyces notabilis TaxID=2074819 RepID=A0AAN6TMJ4_9PEZI|nr:hypothetical protein N656DRAFT_267638 [Canariomyces arenarius]